LTRTAVLGCAMPDQWHAPIIRPAELLQVGGPTTLASQSAHAAFGRSTRPSSQAPVTPSRPSLPSPTWSLPRPTSSAARRCSRWMARCIGSTRRQARPSATQKPSSPGRPRSPFAGPARRVDRDTRPAPPLAEPHQRGCEREEFCAVLTIRQPTWQSTSSVVPSTGKQPIGRPIELPKSETA
jgi:hypothetical protein